MKIQCPIMHKKLSPLIEIDDETNCWHWLGDFDQHKFPVIQFDKVNRAHRYFPARAYIYTTYVCKSVFPATRKRVMDFISCCGNEQCVNPKHMKYIGKDSYLLRATEDHPVEEYIKLDNIV